MVIVEPLTIQTTEPRVATGELRIWGGVRENGKDELIWEFEDCENETGWIRFDRKQELVLRLVWGAGGPRDFDNGTMAGRRFLRKPYTNLSKTVGVFSR